MSCAAVLRPSGQARGHASSGRGRDCYPPPHEGAIVPPAAQVGDETDMSIEVLKRQVADEFGTPAVVIDLDRVENNIARVQQLCDAAHVANRPHIKTHKSPVLAKMQAAAGAKGITCQKLGEAEVMVGGGLDDILISYNLLGEAKIGRLGALLKRANITVAADNATVIEGLAQAGRIAGRA